MPEPQSMAAMKRRVGALEGEVTGLRTEVGVLVEVVRNLSAHVDAMTAEPDGPPQFYNQGSTPAGGTDGS